MSILIGVNMNALTKQQVQTISEKIERDKGFINQLKARPQEALKAIDIEVDKRPEKVEKRSDSCQQMFGIRCCLINWLLTCFVCCHVCLAILRWSCDWFWN